MSAARTSRPSGSPAPGGTLIVTNDFPPRQGGIETFVHAMATRLPGPVVVHTSAEPGAAAFDAGLPFPVVRDRSRTLLPGRRVSADAVALARAHGCDRVWFGAAAPLALMAGALRRSGIRRVVATTHGHELWWARVPGARAALRRIGAEADWVTCLGPYTRDALAPALGPGARLSRLVPGVDSAVFRPVAPGPASALRERLGVGGRPLVLCVARLVPRKGQDALIRAMPRVRAAIPEATLLLVGDGPYADRLRALARRELPPSAVVFVGGVPHEATAPYYAAAQVFAMPCRTRRFGLEAEGLGIVFLEAAASGLPVVVGDSGGAPDTVREGRTGHVVPGTDQGRLADTLVRLLRDRRRAEAQGAAGREWVTRDWSWEGSARHLAHLLDPAVPLPPRAAPGVDRDGCDRDRGGRGGVSRA